MAKSFIVRLKCPYGDEDGWLVLQNREEALVQILASAWDFECPVHGVQREFPVEGREKRLSYRWLHSKGSTPTSRMATQPRVPQAGQATNCCAETNQDIFSNVSVAAKIVLVLAAAVLIGAMALRELMRSSRTAREARQSAELGLAGKPNQLSVAEGVAIAPLELMLSNRTSQQASLPHSAKLGLAQKLNQSSPDDGLATVRQLSKPWSSKKFIYHRPGTDENISSIVVRLPESSPGQPGSYWAFSLETPFTNCQLEYIADLQKLLSDYRFQAKHPMVVDPCSHSVFDPLQMSDLPNGDWARGAIVKGYAFRPPIGIEIRINGDRLVAAKME